MMATTTTHWKEHAPPEAPCQETNISVRDSVPLPGENDLFWTRPTYLVVVKEEDAQVKRRETTGHHQEIFTKVDMPNLKLFKLSSIEKLIHVKRTTLSPMIISCIMR